MKKALLILGIGVLGLQASSLKDLVENATIDGYARGKYTITEGRDGFGKGYQVFLRPNVTTGEVEGFSFTGGLFFSKGSGAPDGNTSDDAIGGSRGFKGAGDIFGVSNLYVTKKFDTAKTLVRVGAMQIITPLNDGTTWGDRGLGAMVSNKSLAGMEFQALAFDSWMTDNIAVQTGANKEGRGIGNDLFMLGAKGNFEFAGLKDLSATLYYGYADKLFDAMLFADLGYDLALGDVKLKFLGQVATTMMNKNPNFRSGGKKDDNVLIDYFTAGIQNLGKGVELANTRGLYNLKVAVSMKDYSGDVGFAGSFGEGYGVLLDGKGAFSVGGKLWNAVTPGGQAGFGWTGTGSIKGTDIIVAYTTHSYKIDKWKVGVDLVYVGGNNRMPFMTRGGDKIPASENGGASVVGKKNKTKDSDIFEISPQVTYQVNKQFSVNFTYSQLFGDMSLGRGVVTLLYNF